MTAAPFPAVTAGTLADALPVHWQSPWLLPGAVAAVAGFAAMVFWLYPRQVRRVRRPWRYVIPGLRLLAFTLLGVSIIKPIVLKAAPSDDRGSLAVLLDTSQSMAVMDHTRQPQDLVASADALGLLPAGVRTAETTRINSAFDQLQIQIAQATRGQGDLDYARVSGRGVEQAEARVRGEVDAARKDARSLVASILSQTDDAGLRQELAALGSLPAADIHGSWVTIARRAVEQAAGAINRFQSLSDRRLFDQNPTVQQVCRQLARRSRLQLALEMLARPGGLVDRLGPQTPVQLFVFGSDVRPAGTLQSAAPGSEAGEASESPASGPSTPSTTPAATIPALHWASDRVDIHPGGAGFDLSGAVARLAATTTANRPFRGVLLISDGQQVVPESIPTASRGGRGEAEVRSTALIESPAAVLRGTPLITLFTAGDRPPLDLSIVDVQLPHFARLGRPVSVRVQLRATGGATLDPKALRLTPMNDGGKPIPALTPRSTDRILDRKDGQTCWATFEPTFNQPGVQSFAISVPAQAGEASTANNRLTRSLKVVAEQVRVGLFATSAGWDWQLLQSVLRDRDGFHLQSGLLDVSNPRLPLTPAEIAALDVLILQDMPPAALERSQWEAVERLVSQRGGSVLFLAGPAMDLPAYASHPAAALLPFNFNVERQFNWRVVSNERNGVHVTPAPDLMKSDRYRLDDADTFNRRWQELPVLLRTLAVRSARPGVKTQLREVDTGLPLVTESAIGAGRSFYVGTNETWRWRSRGEPAEFERFWRQFVQYAADEPYAASVGTWSLDLDRYVAGPGDAVAVRVRDESPLTPPKSTGSPSTGPVLQDLRIEILKSDGALYRVEPLSVATAGGSRWNASIRDLPPGDYRIRLSAPTVSASSGPTHLELPLQIVLPKEQELRNLSGDADRLQRMAESTGGRMLRLDQWADIPGLLSAANDERPRYTEWSLWDSPWLFIAVVGCLGLEWALRKQAGLS